MEWSNKKTLPIPHFVSAITLTVATIPNRLFILKESTSTANAFPIDSISATPDKVVKM